MALAQKSYPQMVDNDSQFKSKGKFQIKIDSETFLMFSRDLYSDPILAIIREYSTNGLDAHKVAGTLDKPIDVHLPSANNPLFYIRDYGTGMSPEHIETVYQTYGASTKRENNLCTGKFGYGSKSALAYVNSFGIMSYWNGMLYKYLVVLGEDKIPELMYDGAPKPTEEPNGLKIQFACNPNDCALFLEAAKKVYPYFETIPNFLGSVQAAIDKPSYVMEGKEKYTTVDGTKMSFRWGCKIGTQTGWRSENQSYIIMGSNRFPLSEELRREYGNDGVDYYVETDTFFPTPAREALQWASEDTKQFKNMRALVKKKIAEQFAAELKAKKMTDWESVEHYNYYGNSWVSQIARETNTYNNWVVSKNGTQGGYDIRFSTSALGILSDTIQVQCAYKSDRTHNTVLGKNLGARDIGKLGGAELQVKKITQAMPMNIIIYDVKGITSSVPHFEADNTIVLGKYDLDPTLLAQQLKLLTDDLDVQRIPYKVTKLSDFVKTIPKQPKVVSTTTTPQPKVDKVTGVFQFKTNFTSIESIKGLEYYIPFEDENTFLLDGFFRASGKTSKWQESEREIDHKLRAVNYSQIAEALGLKKHADIADRICYIRPRFVHKHAGKLKNFKDTCDAALKAKYEDNWMGFMSMLFEDYDTSTGATDDKGDMPFSREARKMLRWIRRNAMPYQHLYCQYPVIQAIMKTTAVHRYYCHDAEHGAMISGYSAGYARIGLSEEAELALKEYKHLTAWMYPIRHFVDIFKVWTERVNEECRCMLRAAPYLFKSPEKLIYNAVIAHGQHHLTFQPKSKQSH